MKRYALILAAVAALCGAAAEGHAQNTNARATSRTNVQAGAAAGAEAVGAIFMPGALGGGTAGAAAAAASATSGWNQPQLIMNSTNAPSTGTFNDCGVAWSGAVWLISASATSESKECVAQREAIFAASILGDKALAFERMCDNDNFRKAVARRSGQQCAQTVEEQRIAAEKAGRAQPVATPVAAPAPIVTASTGPRCFDRNGQPVPMGQPGAVRCE